jgi:V8-like Glu-specific endopeptidase
MGLNINFGRLASLVLCLFFACDSLAQPIDMRDIRVGQIDSRGRGLGRGACPDCQILDPVDIDGGRYPFKVKGPEINLCYDKNDTNCIKAINYWPGKTGGLPSNQCTTFISSHKRNPILGGIDDGVIAKISQGASLDTYTLINFQNACLSKNLPARVKGVIGTFILNGTVIGMGTLIDPTHVITARHVLYNTVAADTDKRRLPISSITFSPATDAKNAIPIKVKDESFPLLVGNYELLKDYGIVELTRPAQGASFAAPVLPQPNYRPDPGTELVFASVYASLFQMASADSKNNKSGDGFRWDSYLVTDPQDSCAVLSVNDSGCIQHTCMTFNGSSGAGIFDKAALNNGILKLVGVHVGTPSNECGPVASDKVNAAVVPTKVSP